MLKDITLGQYFPGDTPAHKLDPRTKIILVILYIVALFQAKNLLTYALMAVTFVLCARVSKVGARALLKGLKPVVIIVLFTGFLNLFFTPGETLFELGFLRLTDQGVYNALRMVVRIMLLIMGTFLLTYTTSPIALTDALERMLNPLKKLHVPVHELAMVMSIALRFIPTLIEETDKIMSAQKALQPRRRGPDPPPRAPFRLPGLPGSRPRRRHHRRRHHPGPPGLLTPGKEGPHAQHRLKTHV